MITTACWADENVRAWAVARSAAELHLSVVTILEIERGITQVGRRHELQAQRLQRWLEDELLDMFRARILPLDVPPQGARPDCTCPT